MRTQKRTIQIVMVEGPANTILTGDVEALEEDDGSGPLEDNIVKAVVSTKKTANNIPPPKKLTLEKQTID